MKRFVSLDILRGLTVIGMILVNTQGVGDKYLFLQHSTWDGCRFADLVFPSFLFIVGAAIFFVFQKRGMQLNGSTVKKILKRGFFIFAIGFLLNIFPFNGEPATWRIMGVMQRIALVYVAASLLVLWLKSLKKIAIATSILSVGYWILTLLTGDSLESNAVLYVDKFLFGEKHLYTGYGIYFDPEGVVSTIPSIANALLGYITSAILISEKRSVFPLKTFIFGVSVLTAGLIWNTVYPFNKPLWSSSFVLYSCGWAVIAWSLIFWIVDIKGLKGWSGFFEVFGTNALLCYIISEVLLMTNYLLPFYIDGESFFVNTWLDRYIFGVITTTPMRAVLWGVTMVMVCWAVAYPLFKKRIFIKL